MYFSVEVYRKDKETFVASCPEMGVYSYGRTVEQAVDRLKQVVQFYLESSEELGLSLEEMGIGAPFADGAPEEAEEERPARRSAVN